MSTRKLLRLEEGLRNTRRSLGDGTLAGRSRIATPYNERRLRRPVSIVQSSGPLPTAGSLPQMVLLRTDEASVGPGWQPVAWSGVDELPGRVYYAWSSEDPTKVRVNAPSSHVHVVHVTLTWDSYVGGGSVRLLVNGEVRFGPDQDLQWTSGAGGQFVGTAMVWLSSNDEVVLEVDSGSETSETAVSVQMQIAMPDPEGGFTIDTGGEGEVGSGGPESFVQFFINDDLIETKAGAAAISFNEATTLLGQWSGGSVQATGAFYDDATLTVEDDPTNLLANPSFESFCPTGDTSPLFDNWKLFGLSDPAVRTDERAKTGSWSVDSSHPTGTNQGRYAFQDVVMTPGDRFELSCWVYPTLLHASHAQTAGMIFDWARGGGPNSGQARMSVFDDRIEWEAFGITSEGPTIPLDEWTRLALRVWVGAQE